MTQNVGRAGIAGNHLCTALEVLRGQVVTTGDQLNQVFNQRLCAGHLTGFALQLNHVAAGVNLNLWVCRFELFEQAVVWAEERHHWHAKHFDRLGCLLC